MPSLKSRLVAFVLKHTRKKAFASAEGMQRWIAKSRKTQDHRPPALLSRRLAIAQHEVCGFPVYEVEPLSGVGPMRILYLHGGAYVFEITPFHWGLIAELAERLGAHVTVPIYPLAPEHDFNAMYAMVSEVYRGMLSGTHPADIVFVGDSAGGNMAVVLTMMAAAEGLPAPSRHVLISPGLDMSLANPEVFAVEKRDPWLGVPGGLEAVRLYAPDMDRTDWRISPLYGDLSVLPPTLLFTGGRDILNPDTILFAERARAAGVVVELVNEPDMIHVWPLIGMPEAKMARNRMVEFLQSPGKARRAETARAADQPGRAAAG